MENDKKCCLNLHDEFGLANRHTGFKKDVFEALKNQSSAEIENLSTREARIVYNWNRQVAGCYQRTRAFSRLKINKHSIVYCYVEPEHYVEDMIVRWFLSRFPQFTVLVGSKRGTFIASKDKDINVSKKKIEELLPELEKQLPCSEILEDISNFNEDSYWENYYSSQFINERKNKRYFLHNIPKKFHKWGSLATEQRHFKNNKELSEF